MISILKKEFNAFFSSAVGYLVIGFFLIANGLFLWVLKTDYNILNAGFADLNAFFDLTPWVFIFIIPAITMRSFVDEYNNGTIEILKTKPITNVQIVLGKFLGSGIIVVMTLLPTLIYAISIYILSYPAGNIDIGSIVGSYLGLIFLGFVFASIGIFASSISKSQVVAFLIGVSLCFILYNGVGLVLETAGSSNSDLESLDISNHYKNIAKGILDSRDVIYFLSISILFLGLTKIVIGRIVKHIAVLIIALQLINWVSDYLFVRIDLTADKRYTLSAATETVLDEISDAIYMTIYLEGEFPLEFKKLQDETIQFLEELQSVNDNINFEFENPNNKREALIKKGMIPSQLTVEEDGKLSEAIIFPYAEIQYKDKSTIVSLLPSTVTVSQESQLQLAIENLPYNFTDALAKVSASKPKSIAYITGNGELTDLYVYSFLSELTNKYQLAKFTLDSVANHPIQASQDLHQFDAIIIAKPTQKFSESEKLVLDQFVMKGGKSLWMIDNVQAEQDSLFTNSRILAYPRDLNLTDQLFAYGVRINPNIIKDFYAANLKLVTGTSGNQNQYKNLKWVYHPLVSGNPYHPITKKLNQIRLQFPNQIDTLKNDISKTPLLISSPYSQKVGTPSIIELQSIAKEETQDDFKGGSQLIGVLLEGNFKSNYRNRTLPFPFSNFKGTSEATKMVIIADGDIGKNQMARNRPLDLNRDKWTNQQFGNKEFLVNTMDYLLDDIGLLELRNKTIQLRFLNKQKAYEERSFWQIINIVIPLLMLGIFGLLFQFLYKKAYR